MIRDPFYREIETRLNSPLDPELFERCAVALLSEEIPGLVPIRGGSDAGMDGAVADAKGLAYPLVSTTAKDVLENLRRSLNSYLKEGRTRRKVILATSQSLTPKRRSNLENEAAGLGFELVQICEQAAIADRLYRNPYWCKELLNLTGRVSALSYSPVTVRPTLTENLIGRDDDLAWLLRTKGDLLLVGQPGSGKTFLLRKLTTQAEALFAVSQDEDKIASAVRKCEPKIILVDDAHIAPDFLTLLRHMREEIKAEFIIVASSWPGQADGVTRALGISGSSVRELELLARDQIVQVINDCGIYGPNFLIREIVDQSEGKPGLAVTLSQIALTAGPKEIALGDALSRDVKVTFGHLIDERAVGLLGAFAIGGDFGMPADVVAGFWGIPLIDLNTITTQLAAGGVVHQVREGILSVRPPPLRYALIRDVFFGGATSLPIDPLINTAPVLDEAVISLIGARARGAKIPTKRLTDLLERCQSSDPWEAFASLSADEAVWVLDNHPEKLNVVAHAALHLAPEETIPLLLSKAIGAKRKVPFQPLDPLSEIENWIVGARSGKGEVIERRESLLNSALKWYEGGGDLQITLVAIKNCLSPRFHYSESDPGAGKTVTMTNGLVTPEEMLKIREFWPDVRDFLEKEGITDWAPLKELIGEWRHTYRVAGTIPEEMRTEMSSFALQMLRDIARIYGDRMGIMHWVKETAREIEPSWEIRLDPEFEVIFPIQDREYRRGSIERKQADALELAKKWSKESPEKISGRIVHFESEAQIIGINYPRHTPLICQKIAELVDNPERWVKALLDYKATGDLIHPFLEKAVRMKLDGWQDFLSQSLANPSLAIFAVEIIMRMHSPPGDLLDHALTKLKGHAKSIEFWVSRGEIPENHVGRLLRHEDPEIVSAAAIGEWESDPIGTVRPMLMTNWRTAIINCTTDQYELGEVLKSDSQLAYDWLTSRLKERSNVFWRHEETVKEAASVLERDQKLTVLNKIPQDFMDDDLVQSLVGNNLEIYRSLISDANLGHLHLLPLAGKPDEAWVEKAILALDAGYSPEDVVSAAFHVGWSWSGNESDMWLEWIQAFERLLEHQDSRLHILREIGRDRAKAQRESALKRERREAIQGIH